MLPYKMVSHIQSGFGNLHVLILGMDFHPNRCSRQVRILCSGFGFLCPDTHLTRTRPVAIRVFRHGELAIDGTTVRGQLKILCSLPNGSSVQDSGWILHDACVSPVQKHWLVCWSDRFRNGTLTCMITDAPGRLPLASKSICRTVCTLRRIVVDLVSIYIRARCVQRWQGSELICCGLGWRLAWWFQQRLSGSVPNSRV